MVDDQPILSVVLARFDLWMRNNDITPQNSAAVTFGNWDLGSMWVHSIQQHFLLMIFGRISIGFEKLAHYLFDGTATLVQKKMLYDKHIRKTLIQLQVTETMFVSGY